MHNAPALLSDHISIRRTGKTARLHRNWAKATVPVVFQQQRCVRHGRRLVVANDTTQVRECTLDGRRRLNQCNAPPTMKPYWQVPLVV